MGTIVALILCAIGTGDFNAIAATVILSPTENIQDAVLAHRGGTTFFFQPGVYREASVTSLKDDDSFVGEPGAVLDGARVITHWTRVMIRGHEYWTAPGGIPLVSPLCPARGPCCVSNYPGCVFVQNLYVDNSEYRHVISLADVRQGTWYYDFDGTDGGIQNNIYMATGEKRGFHAVELGHIMYAFAGRAANITIRDLIIEKYSAPIQSGAIQPEGPNWLIRDNEVRLNHGFGIKAKAGGDNIRVIGNKVHHNGEMGIGSGKVTGGVWDSNVVAFNNTDGVNPGFEAGGSKFVGDRLIISNNVVHNNYGTGLWTDEGATYNTYYHNSSYHNFGGGIRYEISRYGVIENNIVFGNTKDAQIVYTGSDHGKIVGNTVTNDGGGGILVQNIVGRRPRAIIYKVVDTRITRNTVFITDTAKIAAGLLDFAQPPQPEIFENPSNFFDGNAYKVPASFAAAPPRDTPPLWSWGEGARLGPDHVNWTSWRASKQDMHGSVVSVSTSSPQP